MDAYRRLFGLSKSGSAEAPAPPQPAWARTICVASGKGGVGKSILSTNLATARAQAGERVLLIDFDAGLANDHLLLGLAPRFDMSHVLRGEVSAADALVDGPAGMRLLSGGVGRDVLANPTRRELDRLFQALTPLESEFDLMVLDHGAGLGYGMVTHLAAARLLLLVTNHEVTALSDSYALYKRAHLVNPEIRVGVIVNRTPSLAAAEAAFERFRGAAQKFLGHEPEWAGWVPADSSVGRSVEVRRPVVLDHPESEAARAIEELSRWGPLAEARGERPFFEEARSALR